MEGPEQLRLGVLAFGDSITNGGGGLQWGVAMRSWAEWVARGLGVPYTGCATDGAVAGDVVRRQIPEFTARSRAADGPYDLGSLYVGVNDVRDPEWEAGRFGLELRRALAWLAPRCSRVLTVTAPLDLGRPRAGSKVHELNREVSAAAAEHGALVLDLSGLRARNLVMSDRVHLTAFGQIRVAQRALELLARDGAEVRADPATMISYSTTWLGRLRADAGYTWRSVKQAARARASIRR